MATILDLPPELLDNISTELLPHSIVPFVLSCKTIYSRSKPIIDRHNDYRDSWTITTHQGPRRHDTLHLLYCISRDPLIASYIETLQLMDRREWDEIKAIKMDLPEQLPLRQDKTKMDAMKTMVIDCKVIEEAGIDPHEWWDMIESESERFYPDGPEAPATLITLLMFLPELKELGLPIWWSGTAENGRIHLTERDNALRTMLSYLTEQPLKAPKKTEGLDVHLEPLALANLETLIPIRAAGNEERVGLQALEYFLPLPKLQEVYAVSSIAVFDGYTGIPFEWSPSALAHDIPLRRLELAYCCCDAQGIRAFLSHTPHLEVLKYSHSTKWHGCEYDWDAGAFVAAVGDCVGDNLKELVIRIMYLGGSIEGHIFDFAAFKALQSLEVDMETLLRSDASAAGHTLAGMLPETVAKILLNVTSQDCIPDPFEALFIGFQRAWSHRFEHLEKVVVRAEAPWEHESEKVDVDKCKQIVESHGVKWLPLSRRRFENMGWMKEFQERFDVTDYVYMDDSE